PLRAGAHLVQTMEASPRVEAAEGEMVPGRKAERVGQLYRPARSGAEEKQGSAHLGRRAGRSASPDLPGAAPGSGEVRQRPEVSGRSKGRSRHALHADDPGAADR